MTARARAESFGAWVRVDDQTLVAIDRTTAARLGVAGGALWGDLPSSPSSMDRAEEVDPTPTLVPLTAPLEAHVAVTRRCPVACSGCYQDAGPHGLHAAEADIEARLSGLGGAGVFTVAFGGGEPLTHPGIGRLGQRARAHGMTPVVTTSGIGMTAARARELRAFAQVNVSFDGAGAAYEAVRGYDGVAVAERAIELLVDASVAVGVNIVLTRPSFGERGELLIDTCARAASLGAREAQLLRYKPAGRAASLDYLARRLAPSQIAALPDAVRAIVAAGALSVRVDCALVPLLSPALHDVALLASVAVMGCEAGNALASIDVNGRIAPCSFAPATDLPAASLAETWRAGVEGRSGESSEARDTTPLRPWRAFVEAPPEPCASCAIRRVCRGGCKVVSAHLGGDPFAPDPECPKVTAMTAYRSGPGLAPT